jgi:hypothetical protein
VTQRLPYLCLALCLSACAGASSPSAQAPVALVAPSGDVDPEEVNVAVRAQSGRFQRCYEAARETQPTLSGRLEVRFLVNSDGSVAHPRAVETNLPRAFTECVVGVFSRLLLPPRDSASVAQYPMSFDGV